MWFWPKLQLTDYEKKHVGIYKTDKKPGVLRRAYRMQLASQAQPTKGIPAVKLLDKIQIARRSRVFAVTFSGNLGAWRLAVTNTNGTIYTNPAPRSQQFPIVSSLVAGSFYNSLALGGAIPPVIALQPTNGVSDSLQLGPLLDTTQSFPWIIEPNWVLQPNETLLFQGVSVFPDVTVEQIYTMPTVLNIVVYAWEYPGMSKGNDHLSGN